MHIRLNCTLGNGKWVEIFQKAFCLLNKCQKLAWNKPQRLRILNFFLFAAMGIVPSPFDCYQVNRGLKTLALRMRQHSHNGIKVAMFLEKHPNVDRVLHPGKNRTETMHFLIIYSTTFEQVFRPTPSTKYSKNKLQAMEASSHFISKMPRSSILKNS